MDQRPGQNVDLGLYFHREGPDFPQNHAKKSILGRKNLENSKKDLRVPLSASVPLSMFKSFSGQGV